MRFKIQDANLRHVIEREYKKYIAWRENENKLKFDRDAKKYDVSLAFDMQASRSVRQQSRKDYYAMAHPPKAVGC